MTIKTEIGVGIIIVFAIIAGIAIVIGEKKVSKNFDAIEHSIEKNQAALNE